MPSANGHRRERAVLYARVSTEEQARSGYSLAQQLEALREHAAREGYEVLEGVEDPGQSGASLARPGLDRVRDLGSQRRRLDCAGTGPRPVRPRASVPVPSARGVCGERYQAEGSERSGRRQPRRTAHGRHPGSTGEVRAVPRPPKGQGGAGSGRHAKARWSRGGRPTTASATTPHAMDTPCTKRRCKSYGASSE